MDVDVENIVQSIKHKNLSSNFFNKIACLLILTFFVP